MLDDVFTIEAYAIMIWCCWFFLKCVLRWMMKLL